MQPFHQAWPVCGPAPNHASSPTSQSQDGSRAYQALSDANTVSSTLPAGDLTSSIAQAYRHPMLSPSDTATKFMVSSEAPFLVDSHIIFSLNGQYDPPDFFVWDPICNKCFTERLPSRMVYQRTQELAQDDYKPIVYIPHSREGGQEASENKWLFLPETTLLPDRVFAFPNIDNESCCHGKENFKTLVEGRGMTRKAVRFNRDKAMFDRYALGLIAWDALSQGQRKQILRLTENGTKKWKVKDESQYAAEKAAIGR